MQKNTFRYIALLAALSSAYAAAGDDLRCDAQHSELLASIARERETQQAAIEKEIAASNDQVEKDHLRRLIEQGWDEEERLRAFAAHIWRDCVRAERNQQ